MTALLRLKSEESMGRRTKRCRPARSRRRPSMDLLVRTRRNAFYCPLGLEAKHSSVIPPTVDQSTADDTTAELSATVDVSAVDASVVDSNGRAALATGASTFYAGEFAELGEKITERINSSLAHAMQSTEQAVLSIGANISALFDIAKMSNDQATASLSSLVGKQASQGDGTAGNGQNSLQGLLDRQRHSISLLINRSQRFVQHQARLIEESNARFRRMKSSIAKIASFTSGSRLLAMNAHIESTRLGPHGKAFAIVAGEMKKLSGQIKEANDEIEGSVKRVSIAMHRLYSDANEMEDDLSAFSEKLGAEVQDIERRSQALTDSLTDTLSKITASNEELMKHSLTAMSELQFQDPLAQALLRTSHEISKIQALLCEGKCEDLDLADIDEQVGRDGTEHRPAGEIELF